MWERIDFRVGVCVCVDSRETGEGIDATDVHTFIRMIERGKYAHEPQIPSLQERRNVSVESCSFCY